MPDPIKISAAGIDLSARYFRTATVAASPADATETIIATLTIADDLAIMEGVRISAFAAFTVGTAGVSANLRIRRTNASGTILKATGALTVAATELFAPSIQVLDTGASLPNQVYVVTLAVGSASAASTVSAVELDALVI